MIRHYIICVNEDNMNIDHEYPEGQAQESWWEENIYCSIVWVDQHHYCGYARFPSRPVLVEGYYGILNYIPVHGGITYANEANDSSIVYGFDCAHVYDENNVNLKDINWLKTECQKMVGAILCASRFEEEFILAKDNTEKATVLDAFHKETTEHGFEFDISNNFEAMIHLLGGQL